MKRMIVAASLFLPLFAFAQNKNAKTAPAPAPVNLREMAIQETQNSAEVKSSKASKASEVNVGEAAFLTLKDPGLTTELSPWKWTVGLRLQNLSPAGSAQMRNGQDLNLNEVGSMLVPFLEVGTLYQLQPRASSTWSLGASIEGATASRGTSVTFPSGSEAPNSRLSTNFVGGSLLATYRHPKASRWEALLGWTEGVTTFSHSADNDGANFSESARFGGWRIGLSYEPSRNWLVGLEQSQRSIRSSDKNIDLPSNNTSFSTRVTW